MYGSIGKGVDEVTNVSLASGTVLIMPTILPSSLVVSNLLQGCSSGHEEAVNKAVEVVTPILQLFNPRNIEV